MRLHATFHARIDEIPTAAWNALAPVGHPFLRHEFLSALERHGCVGEHYGWLPHHLALWDGAQLAGAVPLYLKTNSYGEFVFDWSWAEAYARRAMRYYPKLVAAIPYTPATGNRLLAASDTVRDQLIEQVHAASERLGLSSMHWLFPPSSEWDRLERHGGLRRHDVQFHWRNNNYQNFEHFLQALSAKKRKNIARERRLVNDAGVCITRVSGAQATAAQWAAFHAFYRHTFDTKGGVPTLSLEFFLDIASTMGDQMLLVLANHGGREVGGALCYHGGGVLYGRHWGAHAQFDSLHFEVCYYQGIEFAIEHGLSVFEPGAQGEHKIARGFLPVVTGSVHRIADPAMREAISKYLSQEIAATHDYVTQCLAHSPYRADNHNEQP